jgi:hypothetical protein
MRGLNLTMVESSPVHYKDASKPRAAPCRPFKPIQNRFASLRYPVELGHVANVGTITKYGGIKIMTYEQRSHCPIEAIALRY